MENAAGKLALGLQRLAQAHHNPDALGVALVSIHGALEDSIRAWIATSERVPAEQREQARDRRQVQWKTLLDLAQQYGRLGAEDRRRIQWANTLRQAFAHGEQFTGTRADVEAYARFVQTIIGVPPATTPGTPSPNAGARPGARRRVPPTTPRMPSPNAGARPGARRGGVTPATPRMPSPGMGFWLQWVLATTKALVFGGVLAALLGFFARMVGGPVVGEFVMIGCLGAIIGIKQWRMLRKHVARMGWWVATIVAGTLTMQAGIQAGGGAGVAVGAGALVAGLTQWLVLRRRGFHARWWPVAAAISWVVMWWGSLIIKRVITGPVGELNGLVIGGVLGGVISGLALLLVLRYRAPQPLAAMDAHPEPTPIKHGAPTDRDARYRPTGEGNRLGVNVGDSTGCHRSPFLVSRVLNAARKPAIAAGIGQGRASIARSRSVSSAIERTRLR